MITKEQAQEAFKIIEECKEILSEYQKQLISEAKEIKKVAEAHGPYLVHESDDASEFMSSKYMGDIKVRAQNLIRAWSWDRHVNTKTMGDFMRLTDKDILQWRGAGAQALAEINKVRSEIVLI